MTTGHSPPQEMERAASSSRSTYAVIGDPVGHTLSPHIFTWLFRAFSLDAHYTAFRVSREELSSAMEWMRSGLLCGLSVTLPHKEAILPMLDGVDLLARQLGAVNTVALDDQGKLQGCNTDAVGFRRAMEERGGGLSGRTMVLLGAGGAGRAAAFASLAGGVRDLTIANRTFARGMRLAADLAPHFRPVEPVEFTPWPEFSGRIPGGAEIRAVSIHDPRLPEWVSQADILVNATSVGLSHPSADPLPQECVLRPGHTVMDMVYRPRRTALLRRAEAGGAQPVDGLWMLTHQALEQFRRWRGFRPEGEFASRIHGYLENLGP